MADRDPKTGRFMPAEVTILHRGVAPKLPSDCEPAEAPVPVEQVAAPRSRWGAVAIVLLVAAFVLALLLVGLPLAQVGAIQ